MTLHDTALSKHQELKPQSLGKKAGKSFPSNSILTMLIDSQVLATIYFLLLSKLKMVEKFF